MKQPLLFLALLYSSHASSVLSLCQTHQSLLVSWMWSLHSWVNPGCDHLVMLMLGTVSAIACCKTSVMWVRIFSTSCLFLSSGGVCWRCWERNSRNLFSLSRAQFFLVTCCVFGILSCSVVMIGR